MDDKPKPEFKIRLDDGTVDHDEAPRPSSKQEPDRKKKKKSSNRNLTLSFFILILLITAAMVLGYLDIRGRVLKFYSSGSRETQHLSEDLQTKFSSLSIKFSNMEEMVNNMTVAQEALQGAVSSLNDTLAKTNKSISSKADKNNLDAALKGIEKQISPLSESIKKNTAETTAMAAKLKTDLSELTAAAVKVAADLKSLQVSVEALQDDKASKKELLTEIDHIENVLKTTQSLNDKKALDIDQTIRRLELKLIALEAKVGLPASTPSRSSDTTPSVEEQPETSGDELEQSLPQPGDLIERDITQ